MPSRRLLEQLRPATLESRLEELGVLRYFSRPRVSNDNPYSESRFLTAKYRPDSPRRPFGSLEEACLWVAAFVDWYNSVMPKQNQVRVAPTAAQWLSR